VSDVNDERLGLRREGVTMALYVSITLMAGLVVTGAHTAERSVMAIVWGTTVGLALAHWLAFVLANRLVDPARDRRVVVGELAAQLVGAAAVAVVATAAVLVAPAEYEATAARYAVTAAVGVIVVELTRSYGASWGRSLRAAAVAVALAALVAAVKHALGH
jgi:hypothetical protein